MHAAAEPRPQSVLAFLEEGGRPAGNWICATMPFLRRGEIVAVVVPKVAPRDGPLRTRAAAAIVGIPARRRLLYFRFTPGNLRYVDDFPGASVVVERDRYRS